MRSPRVEQGHHALLLREVSAKAGRLRQVLPAAPGAEGACDASPPVPGPGRHPPASRSSGDPGLQWASSRIREKGAHVTSSPGPVLPRQSDCPWLVLVRRLLIIAPEKKKKLPPIFSEQQALPDREVCAQQMPCCSLVFGPVDYLGSGSALL